MALNASTIRSRYGVTLRANFGDRTFKFYVLGKYGFFYWNRLRAFAQDFVFLDIGANQGLYTLAAAKNPRLVAAYAFEPVQTTFSLLEQNVKINAIQDRCRLVMKGIAEESRSDYISVPANHSGRASLANRAEFMQASDKQRIELIDARDLEGLVTEQEVPIAVKIDVEGLEMTVLRELFKTGFAGRIREIFLEVNESWINPAELTALLVGSGFTKFTRVGEGRHYDLLAEK